MLIVENEFKKLKNISLNLFERRIYYYLFIFQIYLVFKPMYQYFERVIGVGSCNYIYFQKSKVLSNENITAPTTDDYSCNPQFNYLGTKTMVEFKGNCQQQDTITYTHGQVVNIYIAYEIGTNNSNNSNYPTL